MSRFPRSLVRFGLPVFLLTWSLLAMAQTPRPGLGTYDAEGFIPILGTNLELYYFVVGEGDPDLVVFSSTFLDGELMPLTATRTVAFVHSRGKGNSTTVLDPSAMSLETELADIETARRFFELETMNLAGTSFWGGVVAVYAARNPDRVDRLLMLNPIPTNASWFGVPANLPENDASQELIAVTEMKIAGADVTNAYEFCREELVYMSRETLYDLANVVNRKSDPCQYRNEHTAVNDRLIGSLFGSIGDWDWQDEISGIEATTLVIYGDHDLAAADAFEEWAQLIPDATAIRFENAGHETLLDRPDAALEAIQAFLERSSD